MTLWNWLRAGTVVIFAAATFGSGILAAEKFQKLKGPQIRAKFAGMELTDEVHWYDLYERNGAVSSSSMGRKRSGKWWIENDQLCVDVDKESSVKCHDVWLSGKKVQLRGEGLLPLDAVLRSPISGR